MQRIRFWIAVLFIVAMFAAVGWRVGSLHLFPRDDVLDKMRAVTEFEREIRGERGSIYDRGEHLLAMDIPCHHVAVDPLYMAVKKCPPRAVHARMSYLLDLDDRQSDRLLNTLSNTNLQYALVKKFVDFRVGTKLRKVMRAQKVRGVIVEDAFLRRYPKDTMLSQVLGFANSEGKGVSGVEALMDRYLRGEPGIRVGMLTAKHQEIYSERRMDIPPRPGSDVHLTIDIFIQEAMEKALDEAMEKHRARGAWSVLLDVKTGAILAMGSKPDFDPNEGGGYFGDPERQRNRCLAYGFEPGSVMKPLTLAAVLNENRLRRTSRIYCEEGYWMHKGSVLRDARRRFGVLTLDQVLMKSSNIGTAKAAIELGKLPSGEVDFHAGMRTLQEYFHAFGLGRATPLGLPGEEACPMNDAGTWHPIRLSRVAIGQGIRLNAVQLASAINTIANDGKYMQPYLIDRVVSPDGKHAYRAEPKMVRQVLRPEIAAQVRDMMRLVVMSEKRDCTGSNAAVEGYETAGKTGTAQKWIDGAYSQTRNISSFVGFVPADKPVFTLVVVLDEPKAEDSERQLGGGSSAAHVFRQIAEEAAKNMSVPLRESPLHASTQAQGNATP